MLKPEIPGRTYKAASLQSESIEPFTEQAAAVTPIPEPDNSTARKPITPPAGESAGQTAAKKTGRKDPDTPDTQNTMGRAEPASVTRLEKQPEPVEKIALNPADSKPEIAIKEERAEEFKRKTRYEKRVIPGPPQSKDTQFIMKEAASGPPDTQHPKPDLRITKEVTIPAIPPSVVKKEQNLKPHFEIKEEKKIISGRNRATPVLKRTMPEQPRAAHITSGPEIHIGSITVEVVRPPQKDSEEKEKPLIIYRTQSPPAMIAPKKGRHLGLGQV